MVKHIMLRRKLLLGGKFDDKRERKSYSGYILDYDASPLTENKLLKACITLTTIQINQIVKLGHCKAATICKDLLHIPLPKHQIPLIPLIGPVQGNKRAKQQGLESDAEDKDDFKGDEEDGKELLEEAEEELDDAGMAIEAAHDTARYSELCEQYNKTVQESEPQSQDSQLSLIVAGPPLPPLTPPPLSSVLILKSELFNDCGNLSILKMLDSREMHQSGTSVQSKRVLAVDSKFDKGKGKPVEDNTSDDVFKLSKLSVTEGSH
jgi:hypothetical protein